MIGLKIKNVDIMGKKIKIKKKIPLVFPGSTIQQNYGESVRNHGFVKWDVNAIGESETPYEFHEVPTSYGFYQFRVNSVDDVENDKEILNNN